MFKYQTCTSNNVVYQIVCFICIFNSNLILIIKHTNKLFFYSIYAPSLFFKVAKDISVDYLQLHVEPILTTCSLVLNPPVPIYLFRIK